MIGAYTVFASVRSRRATVRVEDRTGVARSLAHELVRDPATTRRAERAVALVLRSAGVCLPPDARRRVLHFLLSCP